MMWRANIPVVKRVLFGRHIKLQLRANKEQHEPVNDEKGRNLRAVVAAAKAAFVHNADDGDDAFTQNENDPPGRGRGVRVGGKAIKGGQ